MLNGASKVVAQLLDFNSYKYLTNIQNSSYTF